MILHLGVNDIPYVMLQPASTKRVKVRVHRRGGKWTSPESSSSPSSGGQTTGDVATILEDRYHVMELFYELNMEGIAKALETSIAGNIENVLMGNYGSNNPHAAAESDIEAMFKSFLSNRGLDNSGARGVPTMAALKGINHRLAHPYAKSNPERPSFIDTSVYQANFRALVD